MHEMDADLTLYTSCQKGVLRGDVLKNFCNKFWPSLRTANVVQQCSSQMNE